MARRTWLGLALVGTALSGCTVKTYDVELAGSWQVQGAAPTAASCTAVKVETVAVRFYDMTGARRYDLEGDYIFPCATGSFSDSSRIAGIPYGNYMTQLVGFDRGADIRNGTPEEMGPMLVLNVAAPITMANLMPYNFVGMGMTGFNPRGTDAELTGEWTINGANPTAASCMAAGVTQVGVVLYAMSDSAMANGVVMGMAPCENDKFDSGPMRIVAHGMYRASYRFMNGTTLVEEVSIPDPLVIAAPTTRAMLRIMDYTAATEEELEIMIRWDTVFGAMMVDDDCAGAGVATMSYMFSQDVAMPTILAMGDMDPCQPSLTFGGDGTLEPGTYRLFIEGFDSGGTKRWGSDPMPCNMYIVDANEQASYNCFVTKTSM